MNEASRFHRSLERLRSVLLWLCVPRYFWLFIVVLAACAFTIYLAEYSEKAFRYTGLFLQFLGMSVVIYGFFQTAELFGKPTPVKWLRHWISAFPKCRTNFVHGSGNASMKLNASHRRTDKVSAPEDDSPEGRIKALENEMRVAREEISALTNNLYTLQDQLQQSVQKESDERKAAVQHVSTLLDSAQTSGLNLATVGAVWLLIGVFISTVPLELSKWFRPMGAFLDPTCMLPA